MQNNLSYARAGVGWSLDDLYTLVGNAAGSGYNGAGEISEFLLNSSMSVEAVRNMLQTLAGNLGNDPARLAIVTDELRYLNTGQSVQNKNTWVWVALGGAALIWFMSQKKT